MGKYTKAPDAEKIFEGYMHEIPRIGEHICVQYDEHKVWRVAHMTDARKGEFCADVYIQTNPS